MRRTAAAVAASVALATGAAASGDPTIDQWNDPVVVDTADCGITPFPLYQSFTPSRRLLAAAALRLRAQKDLPAGFSFALRVHRDSPAAEVVGTGVATTEALVPGQRALARAVFDPPLVLEPPGTYVLEGPTDSTFSVTWDVSRSNPYPGGVGFNCAAQPVPAFDFGFVTYVPPDAADPETVITSGPQNRATSSRTAEIAFTGSDDLSYARSLTFTCSLDSAPPAPCSSPVALAALQEGRHTFAVTATDETGRADPSNATRSWVVDATPPPPPRISGPRATRGPTATYTFASRGATSYRCAVDRAPLATCPRTIHAHLRLGIHTIRAAAIDAAGNVSATSALRVRRR
ncbi:MAG TPA: hypothetical protein VI408_10875 [Gaiellaceae bacterium]